MSDCWRRNWRPLRSVTAPAPRPRAHRTLRAEEEKGGGGRGWRREREEEEKEGEEGKEGKKERGEEEEEEDTLVLLFGFDMRGGRER